MPTRWGAEPTFEIRDTNPPDAPQTHPTKCQALRRERLTSRDAALPAVRSCRCSLRSRSSACRSRCSVCSRYLPSHVTLYKADICSPVYTSHSRHPPAGDHSSHDPCTAPPRLQCIRAATCLPVPRLLTALDPLSPPRPSSLTELFLHPMISDSRVRMRKLDGKGSPVQSPACVGRFAHPPIFLTRRFRSPAEFLLACRLLIRLFSLGNVRYCWCADAHSRVVLLRRRSEVYETMLCGVRLRQAVCISSSLQMLPLVSHTRRNLPC
jgi:hypothetical protein